MPLISRILFVCTGNICRSPLAEGLMRSLLNEAGLFDIQVDSAGIHAREGSPPEVTAVELAAEDGIDISQLRGRQFQLADFERFDLVLVMDHEQYSHLRYVCPPDRQDRVALLMRYSGEPSARDVVDPYRRRRRVFEQAWRDINAGCRGLLQSLLSRQGPAA